MAILVTGSSGHLGEALMRLLDQSGRAAEGIDRVPGPYTTHCASIADPGAVARAMAGKRAVLHTATLHKPHVATHSKTDFVETNITGTLTLLEAAVAAGVQSFVFTSTTSAFGAALNPPPGAPAAWIDTWQPSVPKNIYGVSKVAAEDLCHLFHRRHDLPVLVLRTARFFPEPDDSPAIRAQFADQNAKASEFTFRRVDLEDAATAHLGALKAAPRIGFARYVISATTPFRPEDCRTLRHDAPAVLENRAPALAQAFAARGYAMFSGIDRVYDNRRAREELGWRPLYDATKIAEQLAAQQPTGSDLARAVGIKGYHGDRYSDGLYPVD